MSVFKCPDCESLSTSNRKATYFWCPCGHPLTAADAVPGMVTALADETAPPAPAPQEPPPKEIPADEPVARPVDEAQRVSG
jgi:hypothetical protein